MTAAVENRRVRTQALALALVLALLVVIYLPTLLTRINGSSDDFMADTGEEQIVLNTWGTLHATGYPLFVILGNAGVSALKAMGTAPETAPTLIALFWGLLALGLVYALVLHLTDDLSLAVGVTGLLGLARWVWIHNAIPEVYSFALLLLVLLIALASWRTEIPHRLEWLALVGGIAIGHHRGLVLAVPAVLYAVYPQLMSEIKKQPHRIVLLLFLGLLGLVPYVYLPLRAHMGAAWVYGEPGTLSGLIDQFTAREVPYIVGMPDSIETLAGKFSTLNDLLLNELTLPGLALGLAGLVVAIRTPDRRRSGLTFLILGVTAYLFDLLLFNDILAPVVFPMTLALAFGWVLLFDALLEVPRWTRLVNAAVIAFAVCLGAWLVARNFGFIYDLTHDSTAYETIQMAQLAPPGSTLMFDWGVRYFAVGFAQDVLGELKQVRRADDKSDLGALVKAGPLVTPDYTFYLHPVGWWEDKLETPVYLHAAGPHLVQIETAPEQLSSDAVLSKDCDALAPIQVARQSVQSLPNTLALQVTWAACRKPPRDLSVFVHLLDAGGNVIAQADESAPVYGLRPLTGWQTGEVIRDIYPLPDLRPRAAMIQFGLYEQVGGRFKNYVVNQVAVPAGR